MHILLIVYDNGSYIATFPLGIAYIASVLKKEGHKVTIYNQDVHHYPEEHLTWYLDNNNFDVVGLGMCGGYYQYRRLLKISEAVNKSKNRNKFAYVIGGHMVSPEPGYFFHKVNPNVIITGEGEKAVIKLSHILDLYKAKLLLCKEGVIKDIDSIPFPAWDLFPMTYYRLIREPNCSKNDFVGTVITSRGCIYNCNFCYRMVKGIRLRNVQSIIDEIKLLQKNYGITYINFSDELTMSSKLRMYELCNAILKANLKIKWRCEGRLNYADKDILTIMKKAGCVFVNYGIESLDNQVLKNMNKNLTVDQIYKGIENTLKVGLSPGLNIIWGNIGDNAQTLKKGVDFLLRYDDCAQLRTIRPVTPYPGCPLYYYAIEKGLLKGIEDFYENKHVNSDLLCVNFTDIPNDRFHYLLLQANVKLLRNYYSKHLTKSIETAIKLYQEKDVTFRGFRQS